VKSSASVYVIQRNSCPDVQGPAGLMLPIVELNILFFPRDVERIGIPFTYVIYLFLLAQINKDVHNLSNSILTLPAALPYVNHGMSLLLCHRLKQHYIMYSLVHPYLG
jgi:hypothetical protein